jgi:PAP_fibrillin
MDLTIHTPNGDLPAVVSHDAVCYECPQQLHRLKVTFKGSTLMPATQVLSNPILLNVWNQTFVGAYTKADKERHLLSKALKSMLTWWFQMELPTDDDAATRNDHSMQFRMKRAPRGYLDVLYMSETARITRGNRGTLVVVEPMTCTSEA